MAASTLGGISIMNGSYFCTNSTKVVFTKADNGVRTWLRSPSKFSLSAKSLDSSLISCGPSFEARIGNLKVVSEEKRFIKVASLPNPMIPNSLETRQSIVKVESLITEICDTSIAEFELKLSGFHLHVTRGVNSKGRTYFPSSPISTERNTGSIDSNESTTTTHSVTIVKSKPSLDGIQRMIGDGTDEGFVILKSPKVGYFRRSRTIKGKRAPFSCKEKQIVKEGQVLCYIEQLGGEIPVESDVSGEVMKILKEDGEPVGYGDALISILPSFPGIKKLQ